MADDIEIPIGDGMVRVPRWATEATALQMSKLNEASAKALTELVRQTKHGNKLVADNEKIFRELKNAKKSDQDEQEKSEKKLGKIRSKHGKALDKASGTLIKTSKGLLDAFNKDSLAGIAAVLGGMVGLGAAAGFGIGVLENFAKNVSELSNVGIGLGSSLIDLRHQATSTGLSMEDYGKLVMSQGPALRAMGDSAQDGAANFSLMSREVRLAAREFNNFGLSNFEFNEMLLAEVDMMRRGGMNQTQIQNRLAFSMNELMLEMSGLAAITGQDRRDLVRARFDQAADPSIMAFRMQRQRDGRGESENFNSLTALFSAGGEIGEQLGMAVALSIANDIPLQAASNEMVRSLSIINQSTGAAIMNLDRFIQDNYESMDPRLFNAEVTSRLAALGDAIPTADLDRLGLLASLQVEGASDLLTFVGNLQGLETSVIANMEAMQTSADALVSTEILALASTIEETGNRIRDSALTSIITALGVDVTDSGQHLVDAIRAIGDRFGPDGTLMDGVAQSYSEMTTGMQRLTHATVAATVALGILAASGAARPVLRAIRGGGALAAGAAGALSATRIAAGTSRMMAGVRGLLSGAAAAARTSAAAAASVAASSGSLISRYLPMFASIARIANPVGAAIAGLGISGTGLGAPSELYQQENPFPHDGTAEEQAEWQRQRDASLRDGPIPGPGVATDYTSHSALTPPFSSSSSISQQALGPTNDPSQAGGTNYNPAPPPARSNSAIMEEYARRTAESIARIDRTLRENQ